MLPTLGNTLNPYAARVARVLLPLLPLLPCFAIYIKKQRKSNKVKKYMNPPPTMATYYYYYSLALAVRGFGVLPIAGNNWQQWQHSIIELMSTISRCQA